MGARLTNARTCAAALLAAACLWAVLALPALAAEHIAAFEVDLAVSPARTLAVEETIRVRAEGREIRRGIFRDIPTIYRAPDKSVYDIELKVESVARDGRPEPFRVEALSNGKRIRIGDPDVFLESGEHTYVIGYTVRNVIGFFEAHDEIYWNVTGNGWPFPIERAVANVQTPGGAPIVGFEAFTGPQGARGRDFRTVEAKGGRLTIETTRTLAPGEGLTLAVAWPKGYVAEPGEAEKAARFFRQNLPVFVSALGFVALLGYYLSMWLRVGVDPPPGTPFPRFAPPAGMGPAAVRFVRRMGYDRKALTATLISIAAKGVMKIVDDGRKFTLVKTGDDTSALTAGERRIAQTLFGAGRRQIEMDNDHHAVFGAAVNKLKTSLDEDYERAAFVRNQLYFWIGIGLTVLVALFTALASPAREPAIVLTGFISAMAVVIGLMGMRTWRQMQVASSSFGERIAKLFNALVFGFALLVLIGFSLSMGAALAEFVSFWTPALLAGMAVLNIVFFELLKAPTLAGRKIMDEIEGFRMYLQTAEAPRLQNLEPPEMTPELFERFLPYAIALDVENDWSERFEAEMAAAQTDPDTQRPAYRPSFYSGSRFSRLSTASFAGALGGALSSAAASAATAPGSSSGMGGGGFSGGGGGGGGGGGW